VIVQETTLHLNFVVFEDKSGPSYDYAGTGSVVASFEDSAQTVYDKARSLITNWLDYERPWAIATIDSLSLYEVRPIKNPCLSLCEHFAVEESTRGRL